jgi:hypothetical protein
MAKGSAPSLLSLIRLTVVVQGPLGPKTLCNACGLRWAKQMRRSDDPAEGGGEGVTAL